MLIVFEGIDGAGKSTALENFHRYLEDHKYPVEKTCEPTHGTFGRKIRESFTQKRLSLDEEIELFLLDRKEHVEKILDPYLKEKKIVLCDRYYFSTIVYQGVRGADTERIKKLNEEFAPIPDIIYFLSLSPIQAHERIIKNRGNINQFENLDYLTKVNEAYESVFQDYKQTVKIDASKEIYQIELQIEQAWKKVITHQ